MALFPASGGGLKMKTQAEITMTSGSNSLIAFPTDRFPLYATVTVGGSGYPCLLMDFNSSLRVCTSGYFDKGTGAYTKFSANTSYTINYVYLQE